MGILVQVVSNHDVGTVCKQVQFTTQEDWKAFQELVQRATNLWPDAPVSIKSFADIVTVGREQQDYAKMEDARARLAHTHWHKCPVCEGVTMVRTIDEKPPEYVITCTTFISQPEGPAKQCKYPAKFNPM